MKHLICTFLLTCGLSSMAQAQNNFIEISVADTVWMKMESFDYEILISGDEPDDYYSYSADTVYVEDTRNEKELRDAYAKKMNGRLKELEKLLTKKGFSPKALQHAPTEEIGLGYGEEYGYLVTIKKPADALRLQEALKSADYIYATVKHQKYVDLYSLEERFLKKLMAHARKKAEVLAGASGQKLGKVLEITEDSDFANYSESYFDEDDEAKQKMMRIWPKTITVKFALE